MEQKFKLIFFIQISMLILLDLIEHLYSDLRRFNNSLYEKNSLGRKLDTSIYRLLGNCENNIYSNISDLKVKVPCNIKQKNKKLCTINKKGDKEKNEELYRSSLNKQELIKRLMKNKCTMLHGTYTHYEKKIMNGLNDEAFFKKMMLINHKIYKKSKRKRYVIRTCLLLLLFLLVLVIPILDLSLRNMKKPSNFLSIIGALIIKFPTDSYGVATTPGSVSGWISTSLIIGKEHANIALKVSAILTYFVPFIILVTMLILIILYYYKNVIKNKKFKFMEAFNE
ncbi:uncharacterized protein MKS88_000147 [Plasmodium brasilianum]|uniref:uncharacterized protein n=1 Tax=Plasmodium brasilianum TaxID=5824 RepID=UPI00350E4E76|nr:hypothetical protein MKS88_000147 [Plasmodium brasilianum]